MADRGKEEMEYAIENKEWLEGQSERILSGEMSIKENGPVETRPVCPEPLQKYKHSFRYPDGEYERIFRKRRT